MQQPGTQPQIRVRRSADRFLTVAPERPDAAAGWATTRHSFSFGQHYDPDRVSFGPLVALNDETVRAGEHYPEHIHRDVEIVTWVLSGELRHADSTDDPGLQDVVALTHGCVQLLSAGAGVRHTEGAGPDGPVRFVQTWLRPDQPGGAPEWGCGGMAASALHDDWTLLASGDPTDPHPLVRPRSTGARLLVARLSTGQTLDLPEASSAYLLVAVGAVDVEGVGHLEEGDALELAPATPLALTAQRSAELLLWTFAS